MPCVINFSVNPITSITEDDLLTMSEQFGFPCFVDVCPGDEFDDVADMLADENKVLPKNPSPSMI